MNPSLVPALIFVAIIFMSKSDETLEQRKKYETDQKYKVSLSKHKDVNFKNMQKVKPEKSEEAQKSIYGFITSKFNKITEEDAQKISKNLVDYGEEYNVDPRLAAALIARESSFNKQAVSVTGAKGLGQIKDFNYPDLEIEDPFNIDENIKGTVKYLKKMIKNWKDVSEDNSDISDLNKDSVSQDSDENHVKKGLASYFKGFTAVKTEGIDEKTEGYVDDIINLYKEIVEQEKTALKNNSDAVKKGN